jgi:hypothetical protein
MQTTPYQLNRDLGTILGYKPARMGEKVVRYQLHAGMVTVLFNRTAVAKKGRREMARSTTVLRTYTVREGKWVADASAHGLTTTDQTLDFNAPTTREQIAHAQWVRLGAPYDRDGYRTPVAD